MGKSLNPDADHDYTMHYDLLDALSIIVLLISVSNAHALLQPLECYYMYYLNYMHNEIYIVLYKTNTYDMFILYCIVFYRSYGIFLSTASRYTCIYTVYTDTHGTTFDRTSSFPKRTTKSISIIHVQVYEREIIIDFESVLYAVTSIINVSFEHVEPQQLINYRTVCYDEYHYQAEIGIIGIWAYFFILGSYCVIYHYSLSQFNVLLPPYFLLLVSFIYFLYDLLSAISLNKTTVIVFINVKLNHNMPVTFNSGYNIINLKHNKIINLKAVSSHFYKAFSSPITAKMFDCSKFNTIYLKYNMFQSQIMLFDKTRFIGLLVYVTMNSQAVYLCDMFFSYIIITLHCRRLNSDSELYTKTLTDILLKIMRLECINVPNIIISTFPRFILYLTYSLYFELYLCILSSAIVLWTTYDMYMYSENYFYKSNMKRSPYVCKGNTQGGGLLYFKHPRVYKQYTDFG